MAFQTLFPALAIFSLMIIYVPVYGQINNAPCTAAMLTSFTPCMSFLTSGSNVTSPSPDCCSSIKSLMANGTGCLCQVATGLIIPFRIPINRTTAISLPSACNMPGVPLQCQTAPGAPAPAPGVAAGEPSMAPGFAPSPQGTIIPLSPTSAPGVDSTPAETPATSEAPTANSERRPTQTPAASSACSHGSSPLLLLAVIGAIALKSY